ncbi:hypothetical protein EW146_g1787 [Bondarzewia mesenterica]|uniref:galacturonan 1,4-alpha-galacturonidase n=1 Tax=Bondarzewia mesenterica TaxID=1095465 RepID=A0A4S4M482_9AGAM|nr:hypothetical protein EW146_g1787 [Bondarzewia mesenterica]
MLFIYLLLIPHADGSDDAAELSAVLADYATNATILFEKGVTYNMFTPVKFPVLNNVEVSIQGNLTYPNDIATIQAIVGSSSFPGSWFTFTGGNNVTLRGSTDKEWGWVDAHGQAVVIVPSPRIYSSLWLTHALFQWWDAVEQTNRPHGWAFSKISNGVIRDMKLWKASCSPLATFAIIARGASNVHAFNNTIIAKSDTESFPFNTDGFSAGGTSLLFENNYIVNGDDCLTVGNGAKNIVFRDSYCEGGHGLSIGSLGEGGQVAAVQNIFIENVVMNNTLYAARFKSWTGGNGLARNITWKNIAFENVPFPVSSSVPLVPCQHIVLQPSLFYVDLHHPKVSAPDLRPASERTADHHGIRTVTGTKAYVFQTLRIRLTLLIDGPLLVQVGPKPNSTTINNTHIQDFLFENFAGTILDTSLIDDSKPYVEGSCVSDPCWYAVANATGKEVAIFDLYPDTATNILAKQILARTETGAPVAVMCNSSTITTDVGFKCWDGPFTPTEGGL